MRAMRNNTQMVSSNSSGDFVVQRLDAEYHSHLHKTWSHDLQEQHLFHTKSPHQYTPGVYAVTSVRQVYYTYDNAQKMGHVPEKTKNVHCRKPRLLSPPRAFDFERFRVKFTR